MQLQKSEDARHRLDQDLKEANRKLDEAKKEVCVFSYILIIHSISMV